MLNTIIEFFVTLVDTITELVLMLERTTDMIDSVDFTNSVIENYIGYARYAMGDVLWSILWIVVAIPVTIFLVNFGLKVFSMIREILP